MPNRKRKSDPRIEQLRQEVLRKQRNAAAKIRRNMAKGIHIANTHADPRVNAAKIARYTAQQLIKHGERLDEFNRRTNQFVPGAQGSPIPKAMWNRYKRAERAVNSMADQRMEHIGNVKLPGQDMTVAQRRATFKEGRISASGDAAHNILPKLDRVSTRIASVEALEKLIKQANNRLSAKYIPEQIKKSREQMNDMLNTIGSSELTEKTNQLTDYQFWVMWEESSSADSASLIYWIMQQQATGRKERQFESQLENSHRDLNRLLDWAAKLPKEAG